jgi:hypothetical protein
MCSGKKGKGSKPLSSEGKATFSATTGTAGVSPVLVLLELAQPG